MILNFGNLIILVFLRWDRLKLLLPNHHWSASIMSFQGSQRFCLAEQKSKNCL